MLELFWFCGFLFVISLIGCIVQEIHWRKELKRVRGEQ